MPMPMTRLVMGLTGLMMRASPSVMLRRVKVRDFFWGRRQADCLLLSMSSPPYPVRSPIACIVTPIKLPGFPPMAQP